MTLLDDKARLIEKLNNGQVFFFAGSGISYMSHMPSAGKILCKTADLFIPKGDEYKSTREKIVIIDEDKYFIQPELFYETLLYTLDSTEDTLLLWKSLSPDYLKKFGYAVVPNINHLFIVDYSVKNNVPIFTTNFDLLFEEAAKELGYHYEVILPYTNKQTDTINLFKSGHVKKGIAYIFKLHGSISLLNSLFTTMTSISKTNFDIINFLKEICKDKHIIFVGYSGRDIDYFPEIKKQSLHYKPFWIDKFIDPATEKNYKYIDAIPIMSYPNEIFEKERPDLNRSIATIDTDLVEQIFDDLQKEISKKITLDEDDKKLLLGQLIKEVGEYKLAYKFLLSLYRNNTLSTERQVILLLTLSSLAHENSRYDSCGFFAKEVLRITRWKSHLVSYTARALFQISESKRMLIAHDTSLLKNINYIDAFFALLSFLKNSVIARIIAKKLKTEKNEIKNIFAIHASIEHRIRILAILQAIIKPIIEKNTRCKFLRDYLIKKWIKIRNESKSEGYSNGIANTYKFETRINKIDELEEGIHIYYLTTYKTGEGLSIRNMAENFFAHMNYTDAKNAFFELFNSGFISGNNLNAIKGLLGVAECNKFLSIYPLLEPQDLRVLKDLMRSVEGKNWQRYFSKVLKEIEH